MEEKKNIKNKKFYENMKKIYLFMIMFITCSLFELFLYPLYLSIQSLPNGDSIIPITDIVLTYIITFGLIMILSVVGMLIYLIENISYTSKKSVKI